MFIGEYEHVCDEKKRIIVPSKFREGLGNKFVMSKGLDGCIYVFNEEDFKILEGKLKMLPMSNKEARVYSRFFFSSAHEVEIDKQGRVVIPQLLIDYSKIEKDIVSIGVSNRIEIWSKEAWIKYNSQEFNMDEIAEKMSDLGI
ncbi:MAG: division/cell wall cluster transcriptional repressor MraZ [Oscillospiraceae bacterium]|nr:division/cell wall cluster transcriptional repressor MraZ [Oscillospiraceae bacterium]